jgi:cytochrome c-type biogenesis protein CcmH/NrfG
MVSKKCLNNLLCLALAAAGFLLWACVSAPPRVPGEPVPETPAVPEAPPPVAEEKHARTSAAAALIAQGRILLDEGDADAAIRTLGQAVHLDPTNGAIYFYLAEAWLVKQDEPQARDYNRLAETYLGGDPNWAVRLARQSDRIDELHK